MIPQINQPILDGIHYIFELPNEEFIVINLEPNANGEWVVEHLDRTGEFVAGLQLDPKANAQFTATNSAK
jgi:hypothetical protein